VTRSLRCAEPNCSVAEPAVSSHLPAAITVAGDLRQQFDRAFAERPPAERPSQDDLLAFTVGGDAYAIRLPEVGGLLCDRKITSLPGSVPELIGIAGLRGALVPVYDLRALLGYPRAQSYRWFVIAASMPVAFAFDRYDGHLRVGRAAVSAASPSSTASPSSFIREVVHTDRGTRPIVHLVAMLDHVGALSRQRSGRKGIE
jgi:chemotaxis signal transduction protein